MEPSLNVAKNFAGKVLLYRTLDNRPRTFLRRNLRDALDSHERELARVTSDATTIQQGDESGSTLRIEWEPPSDRMMEDLVQSSKPMLRISSLHMRDAIQNQRRQHDRAEPFWLPQANEYVRSCQVRVLMLDKRNGGTSSTSVLYNEVRQARIVGRDNGNKKMTFDVELNTPFDISIDQLSCTTPSFAGKGPWERALEENCVLEIDIQYQNSEATAEFLAQIEGRPVSDHLETAANEGIVKAKWSKLPHLPEDGELLPLKRAKGHKSIDLRYGLEVVMGWNRRPDSPIARHSRAVRRRQEQLRQLPTPVSEDLDAGRAKCIVKYFFAPGTFEVKSQVTEGPKCVFCPSGHESSSFDRLHLHYLMHHDHFAYRVGDFGDGIRVIRVDHKPDEHVAASAEFAWESPQQPFNARAYLDDDTGWVHPPFVPDGNGNVTAGPHGSLRPKKKGKAATGRSSAPGPAAPVNSKALKLTITSPKTKFTDPAKVEEYVQHKRKKHMVPYVDNVDFYRTTSKQKLIPGTYVSDSDEEVDDEWMKQRQRRDYRKLGEDGISLDFNELFNRHLDEEQPMSDTFGSDAVVRFTKKWVDLLKDPKWMEKFEAKLKQLQSKLILREETVKYCMDYVEAARLREPSGQAEGAAQTSTGPQENPTSYSGQPIAPTATMVPPAANNGKTPEALAKPRRPGSGPCVCGQKIAGKRGTVACANVKCLTYGFHMECLGLENRPNGWRCEECS